MASLPEHSSFSVWEQAPDTNTADDGHRDWADTSDGALATASPYHDDRQAKRATLPRHLTTPNLGRSARSSSEQYRRPTIVDRLASTRSLFVPSVVYSGQESEQNGDQRDGWRATAVGRTPLDRTMDRIGMGRYQWTVLILSGLGWAADNMWIQAIAIILPQIQRYFAVTDSTVGLASSSIFVGMFVGSIAWGTISDTYGRRAAFNITLLITAIFGSLSAFAGSFLMLCLLLFAVGTGVGGSMPTDSSNVVENLPVRNHSYVTALSIFFSAGAVVPSLIGLMVLSSQMPEGWRYLLGSLAIITIAFVAARVVFFRLLESPKYLVHAGRAQEAREILQQIQDFNGGEAIPIRIQDVYDRSFAGPTANGGATDPEAQTNLDDQATFNKYGNENNDDANDPDELERPLLGEHGSGSNQSSDAVQQASSSPPLPASLSWLPKGWHSSAADFVSRYAELFAPEWKQTTVLVWIIWGGMSFGFTTFNVLLPKLLEERYGGQHKRMADSNDATRRAMLDYLIYSLSSLPGSLISAYMVETRLGRRGTMASSTAVMAAAVLLFSLFYWRSLLTLASVSSSISYAAIYGYTPEVMGPKIRATACGTASAISRVAGIIAPLLAGWAFSIAPAIPLFMATATLGVVAFAMAILPIETRGRANTDDTGTQVH